MIGKNFGDGLVGGDLNFVVRIDKGNFQLFSESPANAGFAGPHEADKHDRAISELFADIFYLF
jgi:hypothetical protein